MNKNIGNTFGKTIARTNSKSTYINSINDNLSSNAKETDSDPEEIVCKVTNQDDTASVFGLQEAKNASHFCKEVGPQLIKNS